MILTTMSDMEERVERLDHLAEATGLDSLGDGSDGVMSNSCAGFQELGGSSGHGGGEGQDMRDLERNHCEESESSVVELKRL